MVKPGLPERFGNRLFYMRSDGLVNQPVLYVKDIDSAKEAVALDPNTLSDERKPEPF